MGDTKRIAVIVRDRQGEALRVSGGLTLANDTVEVYVLDGKLDKKNPEIAQPLELITDLDLKVYSNNRENGFSTISLEDLARKLLEYDFVVPY